jgi:hypothetical protein
MLNSNAYINRKVLEVMIAGLYFYDDVNKFLFWCAPMNNRQPVRHPTDEDKLTGTGRFTRLFDAEA